MNAIFQEAIWPLLTFGQLFGILPVVGVKNRSSDHVRFEWRRIRNYYSLAIGATLIAYTLLSIWNALTTPMEFLSTISWPNKKCNKIFHNFKNHFPFQPP